MLFSSSDYQTLGTVRAILIISEIKEATIVKWHVKPGDVVEEVKL